SCWSRRACTKRTCWPGAGLTSRPGLTTKKIDRSSITRRRYRWRLISNIHCNLLGTLLSKRCRGKRKNIIVDACSTAVQKEPEFGCGRFIGYCIYRGSPGVNREDD